MGAPPASPKVFVSWAHGFSTSTPSDERAWQTMVYGFTNMLRAVGIDADIDLFYLDDPTVDWTRFGPSRIVQSSFVLIAASRAYKERWDGTNLPTEGAGAAREADTLKGMFDLDQALFQEKVKVVLLPGRSLDDVPLELHRLQRFSLPELAPRHLEPLRATLTGRPRFPAEPLGPGPAARETHTADGSAETRLTGIRRELGYIREILEKLGPAVADDAPRWKAARDLLTSRQKTLLDLASLFGQAPHSDLQYDIRIQAPMSVDGVELCRLTTRMARLRNVAAGAETWVSFARTRAAVAAEFEERGCLGREFVPLPQPAWDALCDEGRLVARLGLGEDAERGVTTVPERVERRPDVLRFYFARSCDAGPQPMLYEADFATTLGTMHFPVVLSTEAEFYYGAVRIRVELDDPDAYGLSAIGGFADQDKFVFDEWPDRNVLEIRSRERILMWPSSQVVIAWQRRDPAT